jgi:Family of unknown function (DUF6328)
VTTLEIQVLFGFLLSLLFTVRFTHLDETQRDLFRFSLLCANPSRFPTELKKSATRRRITASATHKSPRIAITLATRRSSSFLWRRRTQRW